MFVAVTCRLHFWQKRRGLLRATEVRLLGFARKETRAVFLNLPDPLQKLSQVTG